MDGRRAARGESDRCTRGSDVVDRKPSLTRARSTLGALGRLVARLDRIRGFGDFLHYHLLAAGKIEAVIESDIQILDIAALTVIVEEAGGRVTDLEGAPIGLGTRSILATNGLLHDAILDELKR